MIFFQPLIRSPQFPADLIWGLGNRESEFPLGSRIISTFGEGGFKNGIKVKEILSETGSKEKSLVGFDSLRNGENG